MSSSSPILYSSFYTDKSLESLDVFSQSTLDLPHLNEVRYSSSGENMQKEGECVSFYSEEHDGSYEIMEADELPLLQPQPQLASAHNNRKQSCCRSQCLQQLHSTELETIRMSFTC